MTGPRYLPKRPIGQLTRGKTAHNRLRRVDIFVLLYAADLLRQAVPAGERSFFVDLGYGAEPFTTLESAERFRTLNPNLDVLGVEIAAERVAVALPYASENTFFRLGGFNIPLLSGESVRLVRAFNVLRQYPEDQVSAAHAMMGQALTPGGLILEGTSDPFGRVWTSNLLRKITAPDGKPELRLEGLLFGTNFHLGFEPDIFQPVLPKNYIHRMLPGELIYQFMEAWKAAARQTIATKAFGLRAWFAASAVALAGQGYHIETRPKYLRKGFLLWKF